MACRSEVQRETPHTVSNRFVPALLLTGLVFAISRARVLYIPLGAETGTPMERAGKALELAMEKRDIRYVREIARQLRAEGHSLIADKLDEAIPIVQKMIEQRKKPAPVWPAGADQVLDSELVNMPTVLTQDDLMVAAWLRRDDNGGPPFVEADLYPDRVTTRQLTPRERWFLAPYFPVASDLETELHFGKPPAEYAEAAKNLAAYTHPFGGHIRITFPNGPQSMLSRWWLALLAHELTHAAQYRLGMTTQEAEAEFIKWQYTLSPIEVQARHYQRVVYADLVRRARDFYLSRGQLPIFP